MNFSTRRIAKFFEGILPSVSSSFLFSLSLSLSLPSSRYLLLSLPLPKARKKRKLVMAQESTMNLSYIYNYSNLLSTFHSKYNLLSAGTASSNVITSLAISPLSTFRSRSISFSIIFCKRGAFAP